MPVAIVVGIQWGDEGKGKVVDYLTERAKLVVRFQGGNNAGHTVVVDGQKTALQLIPSGILRNNVRCLLACGVVVNPWSILGEFDKLESAGVSVSKERFGIAGEVQLILPYHQAIDAARESVRESAKGGTKIGTTGKGIGPAYEDAVSRHGVRMVDLLHEDHLRHIIERNVKHHNAYLEGVLNSSVKFDAKQMYDDVVKVGERLKPYITNVSLEISEAIKRNEMVMFEGAQGTLLDITHGTYPYVTSSNTVASHACASAGIGPRNIDGVIGICKAYCTRVGSGPFPTEDIGPDGEVLRVVGHEFGTVTGRPRRCGWIDIPETRRAVRLNGVDSLIITKLDVLSGFKTIKIAKAYKIDGKELVDPPISCIDLERVEIVYEEMPGWQDDITKAQSIEALPEAAQRYLKRLEELIGCEIGGFSVGPDRDQTVITSDKIAKYIK